LGRIGLPDLIKAEKGGMSVKKKLYARFLAGLLAFSMAEIASASLVTNGGFELGNFIGNPDGGMSLPLGSNEIDGWTVVNAEAGWLNTPNVYGLVASEGSFFLDLTGYRNSTPYGGVSQTINTSPGQQYTLSFDLETGQPNPWVIGPISIMASAGSISESFTLDPGTQWQALGFDFVADSDMTPITIIGTVGYQYIGLDNVSVSPVPLPASVWFFISGLGVLFVRFRKKFA
jgi:hypothetical protein